jgi:hypothetical protein
VTEEATDALKRAHELTAPENIRRMSDKLDGLKAQFGTGDWHVDMLLNLWAELVMDFRLLELSYVNHHEAFLISRPSVMAWRARNLLELSVWIEYCLKSRENARRFYDDKMRDAFEWVSVMHSLAELFPALPAAAQIKQVKARMETSAINSGVDIDDSYMRVNDAARELGILQPWGKMNKLLSKFAHPTAFTVLTLTQGEAESNMSDFFLMVGCLSFSGSIEEFDTYFKTVP